MIVGSSGKMQKVDAGSILGGNVAALKYFMPLVGLDLGPPREPMKAMNENEARQFKKDVEDLGFFTWDPATIVDGEIDMQHEYFYRLFGFVLLVTSLFGVLTQNSDDPTVKITFLWSRVIATSVYILNRVYSIYNITKDPQWNDRSLYFGTYGDVLWFLGSLYHSLRCQDWGYANEAHLRIDLHLRMDTLLTFFMALMYFVFPGHLHIVIFMDLLYVRPNSDSACRDLYLAGSLVEDGCVPVHG
uniref:Uncharacterized protein n=2 Tax=Magallana gigas TaxID=29159 RepID=K1PRE8_MAGGI